MIVRLVLTENEATPDRDLLARLALRHRMRAVHCSEPVTLATPCVASHRTLAGSEERMALRAAAPTRSNAGHGATGLTAGGSGDGLGLRTVPGARRFASMLLYPPDMPGRGNTRLTDPRPGQCSGRRA